MPFAYVSGLTPAEREKKIQIRAAIKDALSREMEVDEEHVTVIFIYDDTIDESEHVGIALVSKRFKKMTKLGIADICTLVRSVVEPIACHPFHEAYTIKNRGMFGKHFGR